LTFLCFICRHAFISYSFADTLTPIAHLGGMSTGSYAYTLVTPHFCLESDSSA
jgi:hypothetical protein